MNRAQSRRLFRWFILLLAGGVLFASGCATADPDRESDLPWATPAPWEGAPGIPGMEAR
jgi:hypothetical protein